MVVGLEKSQYANYFLNNFIWLSSINCYLKINLACGDLFWDGTYSIVDLEKKKKKNQSFLLVRVSHFCGHMGVQGEEPIFEKWHSCFTGSNNQLLLY